MRSLEEQISTARMEVSADTISMSVGELTNLFREGVLIIRPEFQRLYRWDSDQKSRLVESVLLGIPLPSLFVSQTASGKWELVDGLQRVSTLLELQGLLPGTDGITMAPLQLLGTKYLPSLDGKSWDNPSDPDSELSEAQRLDVRFARLDLRVIKRSSDPKAKFDLFQRLNSFGSSLTSQEIRSAMIAGTDSACLSWLNELANRESFKATISLPDRLVEEQYDLELVLRFLMLHNRRISGASGLKDFASKLNDWALDLASEFSQRRDHLGQVFIDTFDTLLEHGSEDTFRKWDKAKQKFRGGFLNTSFEVIALGTGYHVANGTPFRRDINQASISLWNGGTISAGFATGIATGDRFAKTVPLGRKIMSDPPKRLLLSDLL